MIAHMVHFAMWPVKALFLVCKSLWTQFSRVSRLRPVEEIPCQDIRLFYDSQNGNRMWLTALFLCQKF